MERFVFGVVGGTIVTARLGGQFEMIHELYVRALVDLAGVAGSEVLDGEAKRPTGCDRERFSVLFVDYEAAVEDRGEWNAGMEVVVGGMQSQVAGLIGNAHGGQDPLQPHATTASRRVDAAHVFDLVLSWQSGEIVSRERRSALDKTTDLKSRHRNDSEFIRCVACRVRTI
jgi:hypothetical protein